MWGVYIQELPALIMAENTTPTATEAENDSEKRVGECEACGDTLYVTDRIVQDDNNWYMWCVQSEAERGCEKEMAWRLYDETCNEMTQEDKEASI